MVLPEAILQTDRSLPVSPKVSSLEKFLDKWFWLLVLLGVLVNIAPVFDTILEPDGALYASIAKSMMLRNDWVNLYAHGTDWLDKPHFPFWCAALSFKVFGISSFACRLPALLFWGLGVYYCWLLSWDFYGRFVAQFAVLIYLSAFHLVLSNNDVRAEPYLAGMLVAGIFHFHRASLREAGGGRRYRGLQQLHLILGSLYAAMAVMTKGIFILIPIGAAILLHWAFKKDLSQLYRPRWWMAILLVILFSTPELWCLYHQFDLHPEKTVFGRQGVSGLRFFFWDSQFGRFLNTGPIKGKGDPLFFFHTLLWAFLPWSVMLFAALFSNIRQIITRQVFTRQVPEYYSLGAALVCLVLFSVSRFQLPHYMNIVYPFFAIITASWLVEIRQNEKTKRIIGKIQGWVMAILFICPIVLTGILFGKSPWLPVAWLLIGIISCRFIATPDFVTRRVVGSYICALTVWGFLNMFLCPELKQYQSGSLAAAWLNSRAAKEAGLDPSQPIYVIDPYSYSLEFYADRPVIYSSRKAMIDSTRKNSVLVYTSRQQADTLKQLNIDFKELKSFPHYHISKLKFKFLLPSTRESQLQERLLIKVGMKE